MIIRPSSSIGLSDPENRYALAAQKLSAGIRGLDIGGYNDRKQLIANVIGNNFGYQAINNSAAWYGENVQAKVMLIELL